MGLLVVRKVTPERRRVVVAFVRKRCEPLPASNETVYFFYGTLGSLLKFSQCPSQCPWAMRQWAASDLEPLAP